MELTLFNKSNNSENSAQPEGHPPIPENMHIKTVTLTPFDLILLLLSVILFTASGSASVPAGIVALIISSPLYAVFSFRIGNHFSFFVPLVATVICYIITGSIAKALFPLLATAMAYSILRAVNMRDTYSKTSAVTGCTVAIVIFLAAQLFIATEISQAFTVRQLFDSAKTYFETAKSEFISAYTSLLTEMPDQAKALEPDMLSEYLDYVFRSFTATLPATITIYAMMTGYISASLIIPLSAICKADNMLDKNSYGIKLSYISVIVYFISSLAMLFTSGATSIGFRNISAILSPGLMISGVKQIGALCESKHISRPIANLAKAGAVILALIFGDLGTTVLIVLGMYYTTKSISPSNH
ncbi:MAG: DUF2232 domain-containing protein [Clostridia bacterium]|nr:DUF2232 domain-containing protein [Clostridia bacterium]